MKKLVVAIAVGIFLLFSVTLCLYLDLNLYATRPAASDGADQVVTIPAGQDFGSITSRLRAAGLIQSPLKFRWLARLKGYDKRVQAGEYVLTAAMTPLAILEVLVAGEVRLHRLTVPEGYDLRQIAGLVEAAGLARGDSFMEAASDGSLARALDIEAESFEGYLFPDTYLFPRSITPQKIITTMVNRFWSVFKPQWAARARELDFSIHEIVTLASIIEKETGAAFERPLIASVFHNRLRRNMRLETDPTVIYAIDNFDGNLTRKHLNTPTPYNTYIIRGLPPGPIANPGLASIEAALFPAETPYLFFVAKQDRTHYFSSNLAEHNRAVRKYQLGK
jgi:UPF0755 protein